MFGLLLNLFLPIASAQASSASQDQSGVFICGWIQDMQANLSGGNVPAGADRGAVDPIKACDFCLLACEKPAQDAARAGLAQSPLPTAIHGGWLAVHYGPAGMVGTVSIRAPPAV